MSETFEEGGADGHGAGVGRVVECFDVLEGGGPRAGGVEERRVDVQFGGRHVRPEKIIKLVV